MAYVKTNWVDDVTAIDAEKLNHIEEGIENSVEKSQIVQDLSSNSEENIPSVKAINDNNEWKYLGEAQGTAYLPGGLPDNYTELLIYVASCVTIIPRVILTDSEQAISCGGRYTLGTSGLGISCLISKKSFRNQFIYVNGTNVVNSYGATVYYR